MNKPYNELTEEEKRELLREPLKRWKNKDDKEWGCLSDKYQVAWLVLAEYYSDCPKVDFPVDPYNPPQELLDFYKNGGLKNPPIEWQKDIERIVNTLEV